MGRYGKHSSAKYADIDSSSRAGSEKGSKTEQQSIWYKLVLMAFIPLVCVVCLGATMVKLEIDNLAGAGDAAQVVLLAADVHKTLNSLLEEQGWSEIFLASAGQLGGEQLETARTEADNAGAALSTYLDSSLTKTEEGVILSIAVVADESTNLKTVRQQVSELDEAKPIRDTYKTIAALNIDFMAESVKMTQERDHSVMFATVAALTKVEEYTARIRDFQTQLLGSCVLASQEASAADLRVLEQYTALRQQFLRVASSTATAEIRARIASVLNTTTATWSFKPETCEINHLIDQYNAQSVLKTLEKNSVTQLLETLKEVTADEQSASQLLEGVTICAVVVCVFITLALASFTARSVARPYSDVLSQKVKLKAEHRDLEIRKEGVERFVPFDMLKLVGIEDVLQASLGLVNESRLTIMATDMIGYNLHLMSMGADETLKMVTALVQGMDPIIAKHYGVFGTLSGDSIMSYFQKAKHAVLCGIKMFNSSLGQGGGMQMIEYRIVIHTGQVVFTTIGTKSQLRCLAMSSTQQLAKQLLKTAARFQCRLMISGVTMEAMGPSDSPFRCVGSFVADDNSHFMYECLSTCIDAADKECKMDTMDICQEAVEAFVAREFEDAAHAFERCIAGFAKDPVANWYLQAIERQRKGTHTHGSPRQQIAEPSPRADPTPRWA